MLVVRVSQDGSSFNLGRRRIDMMIGCLDYHDLNHVLVWSRQPYFLDPVVPWVRVSDNCDDLSDVQIVLSMRLLTGPATTPEAALICYLARQFVREVTVAK